MRSRRLPLLLVLLLLLGLMGGALLLALDGASPSSLLLRDGNAVPKVSAGDEPHADVPDPGRARNARRSGRPGRIAGDVRDLRSRKPAAGRVVTLELPNGDVRRIATDGRGGFAFGDIAPDEPHTIRIDGDDHAPVVRPGLYLRPGERLDIGTLWLADGVRVAFEVRSFDGRPLVGATVRAFAPGAGTTTFDAPRGPSPVAVARSAADGVAHFAGLPPGTWTFTAERGGYARRGLVGATIRQGVPEEHFRLALEEGYRLDGRVLDAAGRPVAGAPVLAIRRTLPSDETTAALARRTVTDREGRFVFGALPAADVILWSGWPGSRLGVLAAVRLPGVDALDLVLLRGGRLQGAVTRAEGDQPIPGARVYVSLQVLGSFVLSFETATDPDGRYDLLLPMPGSVTGISAECNGYRTEWAEFDNPISVPTDALVSRDLTLAPGGVITGRVMGDDGPLAGAEVGATNSEWYFSATSDREGRFVLHGLPRERFFVMASLWAHTMPDLPSNPDAALKDGSAPEQYVVDLAAHDPAQGTDQHAAEVEIHMLPGAMLRGRILTLDDEPAGGAVIEAAAGGIAARAADDGTFEIGPLAAGEQIISATAATGGGVSSVTAEILAPPAIASAVTIRLSPELHVRGRLTSVSGAALSGAYVQILPWDDSVDDPIRDEWSWLQATRLPVNTDGSFDHVVRGAPGAYLVRAGALRHVRAHSGRVTLSAAQPEVLVELALRAGHTFTGRVFDEGGDAVPGAYVAAVAVPPGTAPGRIDYPGAWGPPIVAVADRYGVFRVDGLDAGPHMFRAWATGRLPDTQVVSVPEDSGATFEIAPPPEITDR